jgi:GT2 family glycosyltransferase
MTPRISVVIPVHNQVNRLRLTLAALEKQDGVPCCDYEVVIVDDASKDGVEELVRARQRQTPYELDYERCASGGCRGIPRNLGARRSRGALLVFLDADACPSRRLLSSHLRAHRRSGFVAVGEYHVVAGTENLLDPSRGIPFPDCRDGGKEVCLITEDGLRHLGDAALEPFSQRGAYPWYRETQRQLEELLTEQEAPFRWVATTGHNLSLLRSLFYRLGGFDTLLPHFEGWDFGIRAEQHGCTIGLARGARSYHLFHRRTLDQQTENVEQARRILMERYPDVGIPLVVLWMASLAGDPYVPPQLDLANWRTVGRAHRDPHERTRSLALFARHPSLGDALSYTDYLQGGAVNR